MKKINVSVVESIASGCNVLISMMTSRRRRRGKRENYCTEKRGVGRERLGVVTIFFHCWQSLKIHKIIHMFYLSTTFRKLTEELNKFVTTYTFVTHIHL